MKIYDSAAVVQEGVAAHQARPTMAVVHDAPDAVVFRVAAGQTVPVHISVADSQRDVRAAPSTRAPRRTCGRSPCGGLREVAHHPRSTNAVQES